jgi:triacylglycerol lipase
LTGEKNVSTRHLVDPELLPLLDLFPETRLTAETLAAARAASGSRLDLLPPPTIEPVRRVATGRHGTIEVPVLLFKPGGERLRPALIHAHGGGMVMGKAYAFRRWPSMIASTHNVVVVSVDYRLAPEAPFPGPQEDVYAALEWLVANSDELGVDPMRIAVMGESAGGGLAAAVAQMVRDRAEHHLCGQILTYPMLDYRTGGPNDCYNNPIVGEFVWTREKNQFGWSCLRGDYDLDDERIGWFSPSVARSLIGLAPASICTGSLDLFYDENCDYARRLKEDGVPVEINIYQGAFHGFELRTDAQVTKVYLGHIHASIRQMLSGKTVSLP